MITNNFKNWRASLCCSFFVIGCYAQKKELAGSRSFDDKGKSTIDVVEKKQDAIHYIFNDNKPYGDPLRKPGIIGNALEFDGFSSWIERPSQSFQTPTQAITISVWVAPRAFEHGDANKISAIVNQHDKLNKAGFALGIFRHGRWSFQLGNGSVWTEIWVEKKLLPRREWSYLTATFDSRSGSVDLYLNGEPVAHKITAKGVAIKPASQPLIIGKHNQAEETGSFAGKLPVNMFNGLMDELKIYNVALSPREIREMYRDYLKPYKDKIPAIAYVDIKIDRAKFKNAPYRPQYHAMPPGSWMNEPHAPFYYNGKYHLTYQHNPTGPYWHQIHWGHWVSDDMVHWKDVPEAIFPENDTIRPDGIWSGSAFFDDKNVPVLAYTFGNWNKKLNQGVAFSFPANPVDPDLVEWTEEMVPAVTQTPSQGLQGEFRDPFVWRDKEDGKWYMLVGSGIEAKGGTAWCYVSDNMKNWNPKGSFYLSEYDKYPFLGTIWELPVFLPLGKYADGEIKYVMIISPKGDKENVEVYYWLGRFDKKNFKFIPDDAAPKYFNYGEVTYIGPSGFIDPRTGRAIIYTIAAGGHGPGWAGNVSLPEEIFLDEKGNLGMKPIEELKTLRSRELLILSNQPAAKVNEQLKKIKGELLEIELEIDPQGASKLGYMLLKSPDDRESTTIFYDHKTKKLGIDSSKSSLNPQAYKRSPSTDTRKDIKGHFELADNENLKLHIYIDKALIEVFANDRNGITKWAYPTLPDATGMKIIVEGGEAIVKSIKVWELNSIWDENK